MRSTLRHVFLEEKSGGQKICMGFLVQAEEMEKLNNDRN